MHSHMNVKKGSHSVKHASNQLYRT